MPYRTNADPQIALSIEEAEVAAIRRAGQTRRRRVSLAVAAVVGSFMATVLLSTAGPRPNAIYAHCHKVEIRYENAPWIPGEVHTACEWR